jgi:MoaA/NifB/PqqE/SkfB family radical SAM enzyme
MSSKIFRYFDVLYRSGFGLKMSWSGMFNYAKYFFVRRQEKLIPSRLAPIGITFMITGRCNLRCPFCVVGMPKKGQQYRPELEMSADFLKRALETNVAKRCLVAIISGGEPLLNKDVFEMIRIIKSKNMQAGMVTNGMLLKDKLDDLIAAGIDDIQLSVYDHTFDKLKTILPNVCTKFPYINASYVLLKSVIENNPQHLMEVIELCRESGCRSFKTLLCSPFNGDHSETINEDCHAYSDFIKNHRESKRRDFPIFFQPPTSGAISSYNEKRCLLPWQQLVVNGAGEVRMCCNYDNFDSVASNIFEDDSYNTENIRELRRGLLSKNTNCAERCKDCTHLTGKSFSARM